MRFDANQLVLYAVTDRSWLKGDTLYQQVEKALKGGVTMVQLREKYMDMEELKKEAVELMELCHSYGVPFLLNDYVELAKEIDADGVHVGQSDLEAASARAILGPDKIVGVTAKTVEQAKRAQENGADYLGSGAVFGTTTKTDAKPMELSLLKEICESVDIPVVAIGGITGENVERLAGCPIAGAAVVSGIFAQADIEDASRDLKRKICWMIGK